MRRGPRQPTEPIRCPPEKGYSQFLVAVLLFIAIYFCLFSFDPKSMLPGKCNKSFHSTNGSRINFGNTTVRLDCRGGNYLGLYVLYIVATIGGILIAHLNLPPLLGMMLMGFGLRNFEYVNVIIYISKVSSSNLRNLALTVILIRAGLGLDPNVLKKLSFAVLRLAFIPCLVEAVVEAIISRFLLGLSWGFSFTLGFTLAAVSPAVVVPSMLDLESRGLGVDEGINTLVIAASSIDDVLAISGFGVSMGLAFSSSSNIALQIFRGPLEAMAGVTYGVIIGLLLWYLPSLDDAKLCFYRSVMLYVMAVLAMFGSYTLNIPGAGALGVLVLSFVAGIGWRRRDSSWNGIKNQVTESTDKVWWIAQPFLFGLIGASIDIYIINWNTVLMGIAVLMIGLFFRLIASFVAVFGTSLRLKERLFIPIAWLPKATVQAAIGPQVFDYAVKNNLGYGMIATGELIMAVAAISIILTAPLGAALISCSSGLLLQKSRRINPDTISSDNIENCPPPTTTNSKEAPLNLKLFPRDDESTTQ